ncbi:MAG: response regulator [Acidobacteriota bacterium]
MALKKVLVADDSRVFRMLVAEVLREVGLEVHEAPSGREALDTALGVRPELLILDALMPLLSGFEVLAKLKERAPEYEPVVFIVTAVYKSRRWESEARQSYRVQEYLEKPVEPEELLAKIREYFPEVGVPS